jgi:hypothetical protein
MGSGAYRQREVSNENHEPAGMVGEGRVSRDYFRVPVGASWKTRVTGRFPKNGKPWKKAKNDHMRLSSEVRMMMVVMFSDSSMPSGPFWLTSVVEALKRYGGGWNGLHFRKV